MANSKDFSKKEIGEILSKASELQMANYHQEMQKQGLSKEELMEISQEVGISREYLELALQNYESQTLEDFDWIKGSSEIKSETEIDGEVTTLQLDQLFPELNAFTGQKGEVEHIGSSYDWEQADNGFETIRRITVLPDDEKTKIVHYVNWNDLRLLGLPLSTIAGVVLLMFVLKFSGFSKSVYLPFSVLGGIAGYFGFMAGLKYYFDKQKQKFKSIMNLIEDVLNRPAQHRVEMEDKYQDQDEDQAQKGNINS